MTRRSVSPSESQIQCAFVQWCRMSEGRYPGLRLAFAVPNGGLRNVITAVRLKREGARPGVCDWILPVSGFAAGPNSLVRYSSEPIALGIEFKKPGGKMTPAQKEWADLARRYGWRVEVCTSAEAAIAIVKEYLA